MNTHCRMALFTPLPPAQTGTADYAAALIPELAKRVDLEVFEKARGRFDPSGFDAVVYQLGNNPWHADIYEMALRHPGIAVLHEPNLHDLIRGMTAAPSEAYFREVAYELFGKEWDSVRNSGYSAPGPQPRTFAMLRRLLDSSRACIVHSVYAAGIVRMKGFRGPIEVIPHGAGTATQNGAGAATPDAAQYRQRLGIGERAPLVGIFGYMRPGKCINECIRGFQRFAARRPDARLLIAGKPHPEVPIESRQSNVIALDHLPAEDLDGYIAAADVVLNLRCPSLGETSGITMRAFALGTAVIMSDTGAAAEYPDDICVRLPCDSQIEYVLGRTIEWIFSEPDIATTIGAAAARWADENCRWSRIAERYADFARTHSSAVPSQKHPADLPAARIREYLGQWVETGTDRARYLEDHEERLVRTLQVIPAGSTEDRILELGCYLQITPALRTLLNYGEVRGAYLGQGGCDMKSIIARNGESFFCAIDLFDCETARFPYPKGHFTTVLCCELLEHLRRDPMRMLNEIHRVLKDDGVLILSTPNAASMRAVSAVLQGNHPGFYNRYPDPNGESAGDSKHEREYTPAEIAKLLTAGGFVVEHIETSPYGNVPLDTEAGRRALAHLKLPAELREDCIISVARKADLPRDPRPSWLYDSGIALDDRQ